MLERETAWQRLRETWDILVVGGGITGAALLFEAARRGLRAALVERADFAAGASSRSSKLVHGGLRYLAEGQIGLTRESVAERERLLREAPGLVNPLPFLMPHYSGGRPSPLSLELGLTLYDLFAGHRRHRSVDAREALRIAPPIASKRLRNAHAYVDATTDDARLVLRLLQEARALGAVALNYAAASTLLQDGGGITGARIVDTAGNRAVDAMARVVVNACGAGSDALRLQLARQPKLRPLRGSHLLLPGWRLPLAVSVAFLHPRDARPVFAFPWLGATLVGTTDLDRDDDPSHEPSISREEATYLLEAVEYQFPRATVPPADVISTYAGTRPVVAGGAADPSRERRDTLILAERGLVTVTGGKLTTFRPMALATLAALQPLLGQRIDLTSRPVFTRAEPPVAAGLSGDQRRRLSGYYGDRAQQLVDTTPQDERERIGGTDTLWAEMRWVARNEGVVHLDDLLLRRTRLGLLTRDGGTRWFDRIRRICRDELSWDDARFESEAAAYREHLATHHGMPV